MFKYCKIYKAKIPRPKPQNIALPHKWVFPHIVPQLLSIFKLLTISTMTSFTPYTYFQCPCTEANPPIRRIGEDVSPSSVSETEQDDRTFDPRAPRAAFSLYPLEHLLYCEDCHQIRCPRCVLDEIVTWFCPNCLFEVPSSTVKSEGNRYFLYLPCKANMSSN